MNDSAAFDVGIPALGTFVLYAVVVGAALSFALSLLAVDVRASSSARYLRAARMSALGTCALVVFAVLLLLYAFVSHDFRVRYVMRYSDRTLPVAYLFTALWGGQDGSLLWWTFLLSLYTGACVLWLRGRYRELAPYVIATLMFLLLFFGVLMTFAANPFAASIAGATPDGQGLNPALQNVYMAVHPPSLYTGFVGTSVPFAFVVAALASGRLDDEWVLAIRKWALFSWLFLSIGNVLGMLWAYEELGWGGYWAWDPVENAACIPWFTMSAYLHSAIIQERRGALKIWNVSLILLTYILTIFGTFLTRSGLISSIHSFAQSDVGLYFLWFMIFLVAASIRLVWWRRHMLRKNMEVDAVLSREAMFIANNWLLLGICLFIILSTTWPKIAEWLWADKLTVGASFYNGWLSIPGVLLLALIGVGTLTPWRKGSPELLWRAFRAPLASFVIVLVAHYALGSWLGYPPYVKVDPIYNTPVGRVLAKIDGALPPFALASVMFNIVAVVQEFVRGTEARSRSKSEHWTTALSQLVSRNRRRYGGYIVHLGIALMFLGFTGSAWKQEYEKSVRPGEKIAAGRYNLQYRGIHVKRDANKTMLYANFDVLRDGVPYTHITPAKFRYITHPEQPTSEVSITPSLRDDLFVTVTSLNTATQVVHVRVYVNPLTVWIWFGAIILVLGAAIAMWPQVVLEWSRGASAAQGPPDDEPRDAKPSSNAGKTAALMALLAIAGASLLATSTASAQHTNSSGSSVVNETMSSEEHAMLKRMACMCGDCPHTPLETCTCDWASAKRIEMRAQLAAGKSADAIVDEYVKAYGTAALTVPPDAGHNRAMYIVPVLVAAGGLVLVYRLVLRWRSRGAASAAALQSNVRSDYDQRLDEDLRELDD